MIHTLGYPIPRESAQRRWLQQKPKELFSIACVVYSLPELKHPPTLHQAPVPIVATRISVLHRVLPAVTDYGRGGVLSEHGAQTRPEIEIRYVFYCPQATHSAGLGTGVQSVARGSQCQSQPSAGTSRPCISARIRAAVNCMRRSVSSCLCIAACAASAA